MKIGRASKIFNAKELLEIATDNRYRVSRTPFGATYADPLVYVGRAVPWKGVKGIDKVREVNPRVAAGLERAISISKKHTEKGVVCIVDEVTGLPKCMPRKAYEMMKEAGKVPATVPVM